MVPATSDKIKSPSVAHPIIERYSCTTTSLASRCSTLFELRALRPEAFAGRDHIHRCDSSVVFHRRITILGLFEHFGSRPVVISGGMCVRESIDRNRSFAFGAGRNDRNQPRTTEAFRWAFAIGSRHGRLLCQSPGWAVGCDPPSPAVTEH